MVAISWHSPVVTDSASSLLHTIVQVFMGPAATCPPYSVIQGANGIFTKLELQITSVWEAVWNNTHNTKNF